MKAALFSSALIITSTDISAEMPRYDVDTRCKQVAMFVDNYDAELFDACFDAEQNSYNSLKTRWSDLDDRVKEDCDSWARMYGIGSYVVLELCVMQNLIKSQSKTFEN